MALSLPPAQLQQLKAVFGSRVPKDAERAAAMLEQSPAAPASAAELQALRDVLASVAGVEIHELKASADALAHSQPTGTGQRPTPGPLAARLQQMAGADSVASAPGLTKVLTPQQAQALVDKVANDPRIPHKFIDEGCHFRSTLAAKILEDEGVFCEKIVTNADRSDLKMISPNSPNGFTLCMFHMATAVWVDDGGGPQRKVIDPSFDDKPMSIDAWQGHMHGLNHKPLQTYFLPRFCAHPMDRDKPPATWVQKDLEQAAEWSIQFKEVEDQYKADGFYDMLLQTEKEMTAMHKRDGDYVEPGAGDE